MKSDIRESFLYREVEAIYDALRRPGTGQISDVADLHVSPDGKHAVFAGTITDKLEGAPPTRICIIDLSTSDVRVLTFGPNTDRAPKFSQDGCLVAFLSDRNKAGDFQLYLLDLATGGARLACTVQGWAEYLHWSPDGQRILVSVAGHGSDVAGVQGAVVSREVGQDVPAWMPTVHTGDEGYQWRRVWVYDLATSEVTLVNKPETNIWEANWCGNDALIAVASPAPGEGWWYSAILLVIHIRSGETRAIFKPKDQLGWPSASDSGKQIAVVEALCSDRWFVAGDLWLVDTASGTGRKIDTRGVDITYTQWRSEQKVLVAGHRGFETVIGMCDAISGCFTELWSSSEITVTGGFYAAAAGLTDLGDCVVAARSFLLAPEVAIIRNGEYRAVRSFDLGYSQQAKVVADIERFTWQASDGLDIQGWLLLPASKGPYPLVMQVHGGPVGHSRPMILTPMHLILLARGYAVFLPNPRGSSGRGQAFARHVCGDMGGADSKDLLSGLDALVQRGTIDPRRIGVTGGSYGGFMTSWLITQDTRFAAAVSVAPVNNQVTGHLLSNIPQFDTIFLADTYTNPHGKYFQRSPVMYAYRVKTPTLHVCGALDRCTPAEEALQFHNALLENHATSVLVTYPEEGHGIRSWPAVIDYNARVVDWFERYLQPASTSL